MATYSPVLAVTPAAASNAPRLVVFFDTTQAGNGTSFDYKLRGVWTLVILDVDTTPTESKRIWFRPDSQMVIRATRAAGVLQIFFLTGYGAAEPFTDGADDLHNLIFPVTATSKAVLILDQTGDIAQ